MNIKTQLGILCLMAALLTACTRSQTISPNKKVELTQTATFGGKCSFTVTYHDGDEAVEVIEIPTVGILTKKGVGTDMRLKSVDEPKFIEELYFMHTGKRQHCFNKGYERLYHFTDSLGNKVDMRVRIYEDGVAFRYELAGLENDTIASEQTTYRIAEGTKRWMQNYTTGYEGFYPLAESGHATDNRRWSYPALLQADDNTWALIAESDVMRKQSASYLDNSQAPTDYTVCMFENKRELTGEWHTPWRVIIVGTLQRVVASTLITDTSTPCQLEDTRWIEAGAVSWIYWAHNHGSKDFQIVKQYIDMAAELKLPYVLIDWEWDLMGNGGTIDDALRYAHEKRVRPLLWYNSSTAWLGAPPLYRLNTPENREKELAWLDSMGVAGMKIDFFPDDTEETMGYYIDLLESAAAHKKLVNFHGAAIPRGWQRTYPNMMTVEAVYGAEWYNNNGTLTDKAAVHNTTLPFTRNVIGPMDYTPCTFSDSQHPHITTHAHELALSIVFESGLLNWADRPESYLSQPEEVRQFLGRTPTIWDETQLINGYPGEHVVMCRQYGNIWYMGGLNGTDSERTLTADWSFLDKEDYYAVVFEDSGDKDNPWKITHLLATPDKLPTEFKTQPRGGFAMVVTVN